MEPRAEFVQEDNRGTDAEPSHQEVTTFKLPLNSDTMIERWCRTLQACGCQGAHLYPTKLPSGRSRLRAMVGPWPTAHSNPSRSSAATFWVAWFPYISQTGWPLKCRKWVNSTTISLQKTKSKFQVRFYEELCSPR
jgi:hypothetical protein